MSTPTPQSTHNTQLNTGQPRQSGSQLQEHFGGQMESHAEGLVARTLEQQTAKLPSDTFLWAALGSIGASAVLQMLGKQKASLFVGQWVSPFLLFGIYNKIVKVAGSDKFDRAH